MKAFLLERYGRPPRLADMPEPTLGANDVLVEVHAAGVNPLDLKIAAGELRPVLRLRLPVTLGNEMAGIVLGVGSGVTRFFPGDEVYARVDTLQLGAFAERVRIPEWALAAKPARLSMVEAASVPLVALTAWQAFVERARLQPGRKVLIHAGSGGVGTMAIQMARHLGAEVATTARDEGLVRGLGADHVIDYTRGDFSEILSGYDVVLDTQGGRTLAKSLGVLRPGGLVIGLAGPPDPSLAEVVPVSWPMRLALGAMSWPVRRAAARHGVRYRFLFMRPDGAALVEIGKLLDTGALNPVVDEVFAFEAAPAALARVKTGRAKGKVVVRMR